MLPLSEFDPQYGYLSDQGSLHICDPNSPLGADKNAGGPLFVCIPEKPESHWADIAAQDRAARQVAQWRVEVCGRPCPTCAAEVGVWCSEKNSTTIGSRVVELTGRNVVDFHSARINAVGKSKPKSDSTSTPAPSSSKPAPRSDSKRRGPLNKADFIPVSRQRANRRIRAHASGDFLTTGYETPRKPTARFMQNTAACAKVSVGAQAWRDIERHILAAGDCETGGELYGYITSGTLRVTRALPPNPGAEATPTSISGIRQDKSVTDALIAAAPGNLVALGCWHTHQGQDGRPSPADMNAMVTNREVFGIQDPLEIIVRPTSSGRPFPAAWMLSASDDQEQDYTVKTVDIDDIAT